MTKKSKMTKETKKSESTAVAPLTLTKEGVPDLIKDLKAKLAALEGASEDTISLDISFNGRNIKSVDTVKELLEISASVNARSAAYSAEVARYGLTHVAAFSISNKSAEQWNKIIDKAIHTLINKVQVEKLKDAIKKLSNHLSEETKLQQELEGILKSASSPIA